MKTTVLLPVEITYDGDKCGCVNEHGEYDACPWRSRAYCDLATTLMSSGFGKPKDGEEPDAEASFTDWGNDRCAACREVTTQAEKEHTHD